MKTFTIILILLFSLTVKGQLSFNLGVVDIENTLEGANLSYQVGYTQFFESFGAGANYRYIGYSGDNYHGGDVFVKYRLDEEFYRLDVGGGVNWTPELSEVSPMLTVTNSFKIEDGFYVNLVFENIFRERSETFFGVGISLDVKLNRDYRKIRFF